MTKEQVMASEGRKPDIKQPNALIYAGVKAGDFLTNLLYKFTDQGLISATYFIRATHSAEAAYYEDYKQLLGTIADKYGTPKTTNEEWINEIYKNDPSHYGLAVAAGHVSFVSIWATDNTLIRLVFNGDNYKTNLAVVYSYPSAVVVSDKNNSKDF